MSMWQKTGTLAFWLLWPALRLYLAIGKRTRVLISCNDEVVVVKSWLGSGKWTLPGGGLHWAESPLSGVCRELKEETGIVVIPGQLRPLLESTYKQHGLRFKYVCYALEIPQTASLKRQRRELTDVAWVHRNRLTPDNANQDVCRALAARY